MVALLRGGERDQAADGRPKNRGIITLFHLDWPTPVGIFNALFSVFSVFSVFFVFVLFLFLFLQRLASIVFF
jgi:hypothetical protein